MSTSDFTYWLQGYVELTNGAPPDAAQWATIKDHLKLAFTKVTPNRHDPTLPVDQTRYCGGGSLPLREYTGEPLVLGSVISTTC